MFGETTISYIKIWNHPIETAFYKWLFGVPGGLFMACQPTPPMLPFPANKAITKPKALLRHYYSDNHCPSLNKASLGPYFLGGYH